LLVIGWLLLAIEGCCWLLQGLLLLVTHWLLPVAIKAGLLVGHWSLLPLALLVIIITRLIHRVGHVGIGCRYHWLSLAISLVVGWSLILAGHPCSLVVGWLHIAVAGWLLVNIGIGHCWPLVGLVIAIGWSLVGWSLHYYWVGRWLHYCHWLVGYCHIGHWLLLAGWLLVLAGYWYIGYHWSLSGHWLVGHCY